MKINYDCIRDVLFALEDNIELDEYLEPNEIAFSDLCSWLPDYSEQDIAYTLIMLEEANYIHTVQGNINSLGITVTGITFEGHKYLDTVRDSAIWEETKKTFKEKAIEMTIETIVLVAKSIIKAHLIFLKRCLDLILLSISASIFSLSGGINVTSARKVMVTSDGLPKEPTLISALVTHLMSWSSIRIIPFGSSNKTLGNFSPIK